MFLFIIQTNKKQTKFKHFAKSNEGERFSLYLNTKCFLLTKSPLRYIIKRKKALKIIDEFCKANNIEVDVSKELMEENK